MNLFKQIKIWLINHKRRKMIKLIVGSHIGNQHTNSRAKEIEIAIYKSAKMVAKTVAKAEMLKQEQFDDELLKSLQKVIEKHYDEKDKAYAKKDKLVNSLQETVKKKSDLLQEVQEKVRNN